jgi:hypothetical protein
VTLIVLVAGAHGSEKVTVTVSVSLWIVMLVVSVTVTVTTRSVTVSVTVTPRSVTVLVTVTVGNMANVVRQVNNNHNNRFNSREWFIVCSRYDNCCVRVKGGARPSIKLKLDSRCSVKII